MLREIAKQLYTRTGLEEHLQFENLYPELRQFLRQEVKSNIPFISAKKFSKKTKRSMKLVALLFLGLVSDELEENRLFIMYKKTEDGWEEKSFDKDEQRFSKYLDGIANEKYLFRLRDQIERELSQ
jgi:hypothetical protein